MSEATTAVETTVAEPMKTSNPAKPRPRPQPKGNKKATTAKASKSNPKAPAKGKGKKNDKEVDPAKRKDMDAAKKVGLSMVQYRILNALVKKNQPMTYRDIEKKTGYYSVLTAQLRASSSEESLGAKGFIKEEVHDVNGKDILHFVATAKAKKLLV